MRSEDSKAGFPPLAQQTAQSFGSRQPTVKGSIAYWDRGARDGVLALRRRAIVPGRHGRSTLVASGRPAQRRNKTDENSRSSDLSRKQRRQGKRRGWCSLVAVPITRALPPPRSPSEPPGTSPTPPAQNHTPHATDAEDARRAAVSAPGAGRACGHAGRRR